MRPRFGSGLARDATHSGHLAELARDRRPPLGQLHDPGVERVYGPDLMLATFARSEATGWRHYLYGATQATLDRLADNLHDRFPRATVVGAYSPPFRALDPAEDAAVADQIAAAQPDIVWVGLSTPKQERWMADHVGRVHAPVLVGVGAAFDFHAGMKHQAPAWMQHSGLEWAYRVACEPRRLAGRYFRNNPRFVWLLIKQTLERRLVIWNADGNHCQ